MPQRKPYLGAVRQQTTQTIKPTREEEAAQTGAGQESIEILADDSLEWLRNEHRFIATGNASATHAGTVINADILTADYSDTAEKNFDIEYLTAEGNVRISNLDSYVYGDKAVYDTGSRTLTVTGDNLLLKGAKHKVTADGSFVYKTVEGRLTAIDNATVISENDSLRAHIISAVFEGGEGGRKLKFAQADGNVIIQTPAETIYGDNGIYRAGTGIAEITGNVRIERGPNMLEGERANVNLKTNVSRLYGGSADGGRVRGVFYPDSKNGIGNGYVEGQ